MSFELFVALRYLRARRRQVVLSVITLVSVLGITTGVAALIIILSLYGGMTQDLQQKILGATAHVTILPSGQDSIPDSESLLQKARSVTGVTHATPAVFVQALAGSGATASGVVLKGVDPVREAALASSFALLRSGSFPDLAGGRNVILGHELARRLGVKRGAPIQLIVPRGTLSPMGMFPRIQRFTVVGVFETGLYDFDNSWGYVALDQARRLENLPANAVQALEIRVADIHRVTDVEERLKTSLGTGVTITNWMEQNRPLFSALRLEKWGLFLAIGLIVMVAALNIVTSLVLMVMEKGRDIAILRAMGATARQIMSVFIWQGMAVGIVGTVLGAILGVSLSWTCDHYRWIHLDAQVYSISYLPFDIRALDVILVCAAALLICFLATLYPSRQAVSLDPVEAIRYE